jgi:two-component system, OmpR family, sensor histidine kinase KdpD
MLKRSFSSEAMDESAKDGRERIASFLGTGPGRGDAFRPLGYVGSAALVAVALVCGLLIERYIGLQSVLLVFLVAIIGSAIAWGLLPSLFACILSVLGFNFFLIPPVYTFTIADPDNAVALFFFFFVAVIVSNLTAATRSQIVVARVRAKTTAALYSFSRKLAGIGSVDDLLSATTDQVASMLDGRTALFMPAKQGGSIEVACTYPPDDRLDEADLAAARWSWAHNAAAGAGATPSLESKRLFLPLRTGSGPVGVIGIQREASAGSLNPDERRLLDALADQAAVAIERVSLAGVLAEARVLAETERLRTALLTSISHDLRTPLASIVGAVSALRSFSEKYSPQQREELLATLQSEAERLNRFVNNLLDMTSLESGAVELQLELFDIGEIIGAALRRAADVLARHHLEIDLEPDLPMLFVDAVLIEQVLFNLLDNAAKYAPPDTRIDIRVRREGGLVVIEICDQGKGIPSADLERVFDKFYRVQAQDRRRAGTGLGLAICRGFVEAHRGRIAAENRGDRAGAVLRLSLPIPEQTNVAQRIAAHG